MAGYRLGDEIAPRPRRRRHRVPSGGSLPPRRRRVGLLRRMVDYLAGLVDDFPLVSIEDGMAEDDWDGWKALTDRLGERDPVGRRRSVRHQRGDPSQRHRRRRRQCHPDQGEPDRHPLRDPAHHGALPTGAYGEMVSHRSGETEDSFIAHLAVATNAGQIKSGAPARGERTAKYNQLLRIEESLGGEARYAGWDSFRRSVDAHSTPRCRPGHTPIPASRRRLHHPGRALPPDNRLAAPGDGGSGAAGHPRRGQRGAPGRCGRSQHGRRERETGTRKARLRPPW